MTVKRFLWIPVVLVLLVPVFVVNLSHSGGSDFSGENGVLLTSVSSLDSLLNASRGKPVLVNFWATWCGPCVRELPELDELSGEMEGSAVFIAVDMGDPDLATLESFRENNPVSMTVVWLEPSEAADVSERYSLGDVLPVTVILNGSGSETARAVGARSGEWFASALEGADSGFVPEPEESSVHVYVVGYADDPLVHELTAAASELAGEEGYDLLDPSVPEDSLYMEEAYLPMSGWPYAQLCVGGACRPPVRTSEELINAFQGMI